MSRQTAMLAAHREESARMIVLANSWEDYGRATIERGAQR